MIPPLPNHVVIVGAGAAGLTAGRDLARAGKKVTILEARNRCGGRILTLPVEDFGYSAEGGAEFVHGEAPVTRTFMREAGLALSPIEGSRWSARTGKLSPDEGAFPHADRLHQALVELKVDLPIAEFLEKHFGGPAYSRLRRSITGMVEGYDAADPRRASTFALRDEWMGEGLEQQGRIAEGYGALIEYLASQCRKHGASIRLGAVVTAIEKRRDGIAARCADGSIVDADAAILTLPLPLLADIGLPPNVREKVADTQDIGFGNVVKILLRFKTKWWAGIGGRNLADLSFFFSNAKVPTWWTQHPSEHSVLTGWFAGPKADTVVHLAPQELVEMGLASLVQIFDLPTERMTPNLIAARAINWGTDPFARGAYSYATPKTREAQAALKMSGDTGVFFAGEALYAGRDMGTVEAALANGKETAQAILIAKQ